MSSSSSTTSDPHGWVQSPPSVIRKIGGVVTRGDVLNDQFVLIVAYDRDRGRYICLTTLTQAQLALKAENLLDASYLERLRGQYQLITRDPNIRRQVTTTMNHVQRATGLSWQQALGGLVTLLVASWYFLGFSRTMLLVSAIIMVLMVLAPDLASGPPVSLRTLITRAPQRVAELLRETQMPFLQKVAATPWMLRTFLVITVLFFVTGMLPKRKALSSGWGINKGPVARSSLSSPDVALFDPTAVETTTVASRDSWRELFKQAYQTGFEDATNNRPNTMSSSALDALMEKMNSATSAPKQETRTVLEDDIVSDFGVPETPLTYETNTYSPATRRGMGNFLSMGNAMSVLYLGRTLYSLGIDAGGQWDWQRARANLMTLEPWKLGFLALSVYRLVTAVMKG